MRMLASGAVVGLSGCCLVLLLLVVAGLICAMWAVSRMFPRGP